MKRELRKQIKNSNLLHKEALIKILTQRDPQRGAFDFSTVSNKNKDVAEIKGVLNCGSAGCLMGDLPFYTKDAYFNEFGALHLNIPDEQDVNFHEFFGFDDDYQCVLRSMFDINTNYTFPSGIEVQSPAVNASMSVVQDNACKILELYFKEITKTWT